MYVTLSIDPATPALTYRGPESRQDATGARRLRTCAKGTTMFLEGDPATHVYEVVTGVLRLSRVLENGRRQVIAFGLPGDIVGFPKADRYHTDCDVIAPAELVAHRKGMLDADAPDPDVHARLLRSALREISAMQDHFMMLARKSATEKVASFLVALAHRTGVHIGTYTTLQLPMSRTDIADFLGLTIETVSRIFTQLRKDGTITLQTAQTVLIRDMGALVDASEVGD